jgi:hypothetical protein
MCHGALRFGARSRNGRINFIACLGKAVNQLGLERITP